MSLPLLIPANVESFILTKHSCYSLYYFRDQFCVNSFSILGVQKMDAWQIAASKQMYDILTSFSDVEKIEYKGSCLNPAILDKYSDVDIIIFLKEDYQICFTTDFSVIFKTFGNIFAYEIFQYEKQDVLRLCFDNGHRFDLTVIYKCKKELNAADTKVCSIDEPTGLDETINKFWFYAIMVIMKLGRNDYLIASHLALELCQLSIVIQMLLRDFNKKTNIHRYGDKENVPALNVMLDMYCNSNNFKEDTTRENILAILFSIIKIMDEQMLSAVTNYKPKSSAFLGICAYYLHADDSVRGYNVD